MADEKDILGPEDGAVNEEPMPAQAGGLEGPPSPEGGKAVEEDAEAAMLAMLEDLPEEKKPAPLDDLNFQGTPAAKVEFQHLSEPAGKPQPRNIEMLLDVNLPIAIELGRTRMTIADILALGPGSVVELNKLAGEPVDLMVNQRIVARGEVVVIDENFGVRVTQLITPEERIKILGEEL